MRLEQRVAIVRRGLAGLLRVAVDRLADRGGWGVVVRDSLPRVWRQAPNATRRYAALSLECAVRRAARASPAVPRGRDSRPYGRVGGRSCRAGAALTPTSKEMPGWQAHRGTPQRANYAAVRFPIFSLWLGAA